MRTYLLVAVGGALGAGGRWAAGEALMRPADAFPWATLLVNLAGCAAIGFAARTMVRTSDQWYLAVTGVLGGLTTYSTFAVETRELAAAGRPVVAIAYVAASIAGGIGAVELLRAGRSC